ncbi:MAG: hypothetical protein QE493_00370 [Verrucomicrobiae bacterium]|nr:hypothetical protein [Verrucomicrobiae bacterium]
MPLPLPAMQTISNFQYKIQQSRVQIARDYASFTDSLNVAKRLEHSIQKKPWAWISTLFFAGITLPWMLHKSTPFKSQERSFIPSLEKQKKTSFLSQSAMLGASLLKDKTLQLGLISVARLLLPIAQEAIVEYRARRKNDREYSSVK